jgi:hypothetical protein
MGISVPSAGGFIDLSYVPEARQSPASPPGGSPAAGASLPQTGSRDIFMSSAGQLSGSRQPYGPSSLSGEGGPATGGKSGDLMPATSPYGSGGKAPDTFKPQECKT